MRFASILLQSAALCGLLIAFNSPGVAQNRAAPVAIGEEAPDFTLESHQGTKSVSWLKIESNYRERPQKSEIGAALDALK